MAQQTAIKVQGLCLARVLRGMRTFGIRHEFLGMYIGQNGKSVCILKLASRDPNFPIRLQAFLYQMRKQRLPVILVEQVPGNGNWGWEATISFPA